jgi:hypothetical protein
MKETIQMKEIKDFGGPAEPLNPERNERNNSNERNERFGGPRRAPEP